MLRFGSVETRPGQGLIRQSPGGYQTVVKNRLNSGVVGGLICKFSHYRGLPLRDAARL